MTATSACYPDGEGTEAARPTAPPAPVPGPRADCVHCGRPTEHPASVSGVTLCPVCEWQEAGRSACSG